MSDTWTIYTDGGARGNPGPAAYAYVIKRPGQPDIEAKCYLGKTTNNIAEYTGLVKALEHAKQLGGKKLLVNSDSELMVKQLNGEYRVKNEGLRPLYQQAVALCKHFEAVKIKHIYRDQNSQADELCNEAMDDRSPESIETGSVDPSTADVAITPLMQALDLITQSAAKWSSTGNPNEPPPARVLDQILDIMRRK